jgi:hypothetical protein
MKWIVLEENPKPDQYIAVIAVDEERFLRIESKPCSKFLTSDEALVRARQLGKIYNVKRIRMFYLEGNSSSSLV